jgi:hypothetical protein
MTGYGTKLPSFAAVHEAALETQETFVVRVTALRTLLIAGVAGDIEGVVGSPSSRPKRSPKIRADGYESSWPARRDDGEHRDETQVAGCLMAWGYSPIFEKRALIRPILDLSRSGIWP